MRGVRALVLFALAGAPAGAQLVAQLENSVAANPDDLQARTQLLNSLVPPGAIAGYPPERVIELRRANILWLIRSRPTGPNWIPGTFLIPPRGPFADPNGYAESVDAWKTQIAKLGASPETIANAAIYLKAFDPVAAREILDRALQRFPDSAPLWRAVGILDAAAMAGVNGLGERGQFSTDAALRDTPEARQARREVDRSRNPFLLGGAAQMLFGNIQNPFQISFGDDDVASLAERWLRRALEIAPSGELKNLLAQVLRNLANGADDPRERARLFSEVFSLTPDPAKPSFLPDLAKAEFEAGDDAAAERDARRALEAAPEIARRNRDQAALLINRANSVLGRVALARGQTAEARARLHDSLDIPADSGSFRFNGPDLSLAEDLADGGERDAVIEYLETARALWPYDRGQIDRYVKLVRAGRKRAAFAPSPASGFDLLNRPAPAFDLRDLAGKRWTLDSLEGKPSVFVFWNIACKTCAAQITEFARSAGDVRVIPVNVGDDAAAVNSFLQDHPMPSTVLLGGASVAGAYRADSLPSTVAIDARGRVSGFQPGASPDPRQLVEQALHRGLATPVPIETGENGRLRWRPVSGAQSYVVEWEPKDQTGWPSDRDGFLRVLPAYDTEVQLDSPVSFRWRVSAVAVGSKSDASQWFVVKR